MDIQNPTFKYYLKYGEILMIKQYFKKRVGKLYIQYDHNFITLNKCGEKKIKDLKKIDQNRKTNIYYLIVTSFIFCF